VAAVDGTGVAADADVARSGVVRGGGAVEVPLRKSVKLVGETDGCDGGDCWWASVLGDCVGGEEEDWLASVVPAVWMRFEQGMWGGERNGKFVLLGENRCALKSMAGRDRERRRRWRGKWTGKGSDCD